MGAGELFSGLGVVVSCFAAWLAAHYSKKAILASERASNEANRLAVVANELSSTANKLASDGNTVTLNSWVDQYMANVRAWADEACGGFAMATHALKAEASRQDELLLSALERISSLIDRGRWFFPNSWCEEYGQEKQPAYRGLRQPILDALVDGYRTIESLRISKDPAQLTHLVRSQRMFVSEVQLVLDPRRRELEVARIKNQFKDSESMRVAGENSKKEELAEAQAQS
jgi:hypothetical protein